MLSVVAAGPTGSKSGNRNPANAFKHNIYAPRYIDHIYSLVRMSESPAGPALNKYLKQVHMELR
jgi:hypothetical protein